MFLYRFSAIFYKFDKYKRFYMQVTELQNPQSPARLLKNKLLSEGRSYAWIGHSLQYSRSHIHNVLNERIPLNENLRQKINKLLSTDY